MATDETDVFDVILAFREKIFGITTIRRTTSSRPAIRGETAPCAGIHGMGESPGIWRGEKPILVAAAAPARLNPADKMTEQYLLFFVLPASWKPTKKRTKIAPNSSDSQYKVYFLLGLICMLEWLLMAFFKVLEYFSISAFKKKREIKACNKKT